MEHTQATDNVVAGTENIGAEDTIDTRQEAVHDDALLEQNTESELKEHLPQMQQAETDVGDPAIEEKSNPTSFDDQRSTPASATIPPPATYSPPPSTSAAAGIPVLSPPPTSAGVLSTDSDSDDFDDFSSFAAPAFSQPPPQETDPPPTQEAAAADDDDDFGDFDDFAEAPSAPQPEFAASPTLAQPRPLDPIALEPDEPGDPAQETRIEASMKTIFVSSFPPPLPALIDDIASSLKRAFPAPAVPHDPAHTMPVKGLRDESEPRGSELGDGGGNAGVGKLTVPHGEFADTDWYKLYSRLASDTIYADASSNKFRWRRSYIRKAYLKSLDVSINVDELFANQAQATPGVNGITSASPASQAFPAQNGAGPGMGAGAGETIRHRVADMPQDAREAEVFEAKRLCDITEDEMRRKSPAELSDLIRTLHAMHQRMQEQANHWLDAKEQLAMDAEMHNKMIASLVQYAQQQQVAPKGAVKGKSPGKSSKTGARR
ncbi:hypothetical protein HK104_008031 [Borealophlyctis nickersoniae]|nr:hypothetical protein HK104_008031 [Borealophlyctis nickersoniae]